MALAIVALGCGVEEHEEVAVGPSVPVGLVILEMEPDPAVVTDAVLREQIAGTLLPWRVRDKASGIEMLLVPPGTYLRGASEGDAEATDDERPPHVVEIRAPFYLGRYEVTQSEWKRVMGDAPSFFPEGGDGAAQPVERVSYFQAMDFARAAGLVLPTESQWEGACRAGDERPRFGPLDEIARHQKNARGRVHPVGEKAANALGFHDMLGNVWEWTSSGFMINEYERHGGPIDARGRIRGAPTVVLRGGSWYDAPKRARASARYATERDLSAGHVGMRAALDV